MHAFTQIETDLVAAVTAAAIVGLTNVASWEVEPWEPDELAALDIRVLNGELVEQSTHTDIWRANVQLGLTCDDLAEGREILSEAVGAIVADSTVAGRLLRLVPATQDSEAQQHGTNLFGSVVHLAADFAVARQSLSF